METRHACERTDRQTRVTSGQKHRNYHQHNNKASVTWPEQSLHHIKREQKLARWCDSLIGQWNFDGSQSQQHKGYQRWISSFFSQLSSIMYLFWMYIWGYVFVRQKYTFGICKHAALTKSKLKEREKERKKYVTVIRESSASARKFRP